MTDNFNENNNQEPQKQSWTDGNKKTLTFMALCLSAFLGGLTAMLILGMLMHLPFKAHHHHMAYHKPYEPTPFNSEFMDKAFDDMDKNFREMEKDFAFYTPAKPPIPMNKMHRIVNVIEGEDEYKIRINLKRFANDEKNINLDIKPDFVKISGKANIKDKHEESNFSYTKEFSLGRKIDINNIKKERVGNFYIVTLPIEDND